LRRHAWCCCTAWAPASWVSSNWPILPEVLPLVQPGPALQKVKAFVSHGVLDDKLGIHFGRNASQVLESYQVPLDYREYQAGHALTMAMATDFQQWLAAQI